MASIATEKSAAAAHADSLSVTIYRQKRAFRLRNVQVFAFNRHSEAEDCGKECRKKNAFTKTAKGLIMRPCPISSNSV